MQFYFNLELLNIYHKHVAMCTIDSLILMKFNVKLGRSFIPGQFHIIVFWFSLLVTRLSPSPDREFVCCDGFFDVTAM